MNKNLDKLDKLARALYEAGRWNAEIWTAVFDKLELIALWDNFCQYTENTDSAEYDDEVYEALNTMGYWKDK